MLRTKLNNHGTVLTLGSKLHEVNPFDSYRIHGNGARGENGGRFDQLAQFLFSNPLKFPNVPLNVLEQSCGIRCSLGGCNHVPFAIHPDVMFLAAGKTITTREH